MSLRTPHRRLQSAGDMWVWRAWCTLSVLAYTGAENARMEQLYAKLERLERLNSLEPEGGDGEQLEMVVELAAAVPDLQADQLEILLDDLRDAEASPFSDIDYNMPEDDYHLNDDADEAVFGDEGEDAGDSRVSFANVPDEWSELDLRQAALKHWRRVDNNTGCKEPTLRSICVQQVHPHAARHYLPPCVVLHRCAADTGCCQNLKLSCAPLLTHLQLVRLPFYVLTVGSGGSRNLAIWLPFVNHTRCGCLNRTAAAAAVDVERTMVEDALAGSQRERSSGGMASDDTTWSPHTPPKQRSSERDSTQEPPGADSTSRSCNCPGGFTTNFSPKDRTCTCVCSGSDCLSLARGREHFGLRDRLCMKRGECEVPRCEFGVYNRAAGRCPKRRDRNRADRAANRLTF